jgi:hypothetical protein
MPVLATVRERWTRHDQQHPARLMKAPGPHRRCSNPWVLRVPWEKSRERGKRPHLLRISGTRKSVVAVAALFRALSKCLSEEFLNHMNHM